MTSASTYTYEVDLAGMLGGVTRARGRKKGVQEFLSTDPLTSSYPMLTPYQFASNTPIQAIDLDGLESVAVAGNGDNFEASENNAFHARAYWLSERYGYTLVTVTTGMELRNALISETTTAGYVDKVVIFSHGFDNGVMLNDGNGIYGGVESYSSSISGAYANVKDFANSASSGDIRFSHDAVIVLGTCNGCADGNTTTSIGGELSSSLGVIVIASTTNVQPEIIDGKETGNLIAEDYEGNRGSFLSIQTVYDYSVNLPDGTEFSGTANSALDAEAAIRGFDYNESGSSNIEARQVTRDLGDTIDPGSL